LRISALDRAVALLQYSAMGNPARAVREGRRPARHTSGIGACLVVLLVAACGGDSQQPAAGARRPNVLLVVLDTARPDYFSCYGHPHPTTPRIDRLAAEGVRYDRAYSTDFWTLPAHASLLTGLYPTEAGATAETNYLPARVVTLAEHLRRHGYSTGAVVDNPWISRERGFAQGFGEFEEMWREEELIAVDPFSPLTEQHVVDRALEWLNRQTRTSAFFLFVNFNVTHMPYTPTREFWRRSATRNWPEERVRFLEGLTGIRAYLAGALRLDETDFQIMRELYRAEIAMADAQVGQLVDALAERALLDDTLVIITSDHGENLGDHGLIDHALSMYETTLRIPLIIRYPKRFEAGVVSSELVSVTDILPTVLDVCGLSDSPQLLRTTAASLCAPDRPRRRFVVAENERPINTVAQMKRKHPSFDTRTIDHRMRAVRAERYKLIWREGFKTEVFDLDTDPDESRDIAAARPDILEDLLKRLDAWMASVDPESEAQSFESQDRESVQKLRSLGYLE
jgi:arylsulfatase A-like enzyme